MTKELCHGLPPSRAKGGHDPGTSPDPTGHRLRLGPVRYATQNPPAGEGTIKCTDRSGTAPEQSCDGRGRIKACGTAAGHRQKASRGYGSGSVGPVSVYRGTEETNAELVSDPLTAQTVYVDGIHGMEMRNGVATINFVRHVFPAHNNVEGSQAQNLVVLRLAIPGQQLESFATWFRDASNAVLKSNEVQGEGESEPTKDA